jgi:4-methyl-5(b-hydroxyethyl)-thiazole monophosphate biosynthesis
MQTKLYLKNKFIYMRLFIVLSNGFEDIEAFTVVDVLRRAGIAIDTVGIPGTMITSKSGIRITTDKKFSEINIDEYDGIVLPGGEENVKNLSNHLPLLSALERFNTKGKLIAAVCAAPTILAKLGMLKDKKATVYPGLEKVLSYPRPEKVVVDGNIITSQGPGTALEFALKIVEVLLGQNKALLLRKSLVA